jgi:predicted permease
VQHLLIVAEISLSFVLLVAAALITRSLIRLSAQNPGFRTERLLAVKLDLPPSRYGDRTRIESFYRDLLPRLKSLPGVQAVTGRQGAPFTQYHSVEYSSDVVPEGAQPGTLPPGIESREVLPNYFEVLGIPVTEGRSFNEADVSKGRFTASIVNQAMANAFWSGHSAINKRLGGGIVVGVVDNPKEFSLGERSQPVYYTPGRADRNDLTLLIRTVVEPQSVATAIRREVRAVDPELPVDRIETMQGLIAATQARERDRVILIGVFAVLAVILVLVGLYGVISRTVGQRTRELGIRIAIGARPGEVLWLILRQSLLLAGAGVLLGYGAALAATRLISSFLFGITATDISTYVLIAVSLIGLSLAAACNPARRAARIDPAESLRAD